MDVAEIPVVILAGGRGARFDHESDVLPKPLIEVAGKPILEHIVDGFVAQGFKNFIIATGHLHEKVDAWVLSQAKDISHMMFYYGPRTWSRRADGASIMAVDTGEDSHTGKRLGVLYSKGYLDRPFVLTYGDGLSDVQMIDVIEHHEHFSERGRIQGRWGREPLLTLTTVNPPGRFGVVKFFDGMPDGMVKEFGEKPTADWINGGFMYVDPRFVEQFIITDEPHGHEELEAYAIKAAALNRQVLALRHTGYWRCMDTRRDLEQIEADVKLANGLLPWRKDLVW